MIYQIKDCVFNTKNRTLSRGGLTQLLPPKIFKLILLFIESGGEVVSKEQIKRKVWCGQIVCETTLYKVIQRLRALLGDDGEEQAFIKTIHGEGYLMTFQRKKIGFWRQLSKKIA
jgi:DNA-binding winged helix-turn-helix (wHTH) protein